MRTLIVILMGLALLASLVFSFSYINRHRAQPLINAAYLFLLLWFIFTIVDYCYGVLVAGYSPLDELGIHLIIFGLPALVAWLVGRKF